jgi:hypothetical protein
MKRGLTLGFIAAGLLLGSGIAGAVDYCVTFQQEPENLVFVGRGFKVPAKNTCRPWIGFTAQNGENSPSSGTGCTSSDGKEMSLMFTTAFPQDGDHFEEDQIVISLPAGTAADSFTEFIGGVGDSGTGIAGNGAKCSKIAVPSPVPVTLNARTSSNTRRRGH